jgi:hypothetical protein
MMPLRGLMEGAVVLLLLTPLQGYQWSFRTAGVYGLGAGLVDSSAC